MYHLGMVGMEVCAESRNKAKSFQPVLCIVYYVCGMILKTGASCLSTGGSWGNQACTALYGKYLAKPAVAWHGALLVNLMLWITLSRGISQ